MAEANEPTVVSRLFDLANSLGPPLIESLKSTKKDTAAMDQDALMVRLHDNALNGSGPSDPIESAQSAPRTLLDQITGRIDSSNPATPRGNNNTILIVAAVAIVGLLVLRRR